MQSLFLIQDKTMTAIHRIVHRKYPKEHLFSIQALQLRETI